MRTDPHAVSIIVPTYHEQPNIRPLVQRVFKAMSDAGIEAELIIVDDNSQDGTQETVAELQSEYPVRLITRREGRGLSSAVIAGFGEARHDRFVVLDADLQHPPERIPALLERIEGEACDFVIGTRYGAGGTVAAEWPLMRRLASVVATMLARPLAPLSDPMSGFFAIHRKTWVQAAPLDPIGYKIALELYVKGRCSRPGEVPIQFGARAAGVSKLGVAEKFRYLWHLAKLYRFRFPRITAIALVLALAVPILLLLVIVSCYEP